MNSIKLTSVDLSGFANFANAITISYDNSNYAWEELGGGERYEIILDIINNSILAHQNSEDSDTLTKRFLGTEIVGISEDYIEWGNFEGCYSLYSNSIDKRWEADFQGNCLNDSNNLSEEEINLISENLNPKVILQIAIEAIEKTK